MISRGTTPTYKLTLPQDIDLTAASSVYVTFSDTYYKKIIEKTGEELSIDTNIIEVYLTQAETLMFPSGSVLVQVNWTIQEGSVTKRIATEIKRVESCRNLKEEVI